MITTYFIINNINFLYFIYKKIIFLSMLIINIYFNKNFNKN